MAKRARGQLHCASTIAVLLLVLSCFRTGESQALTAAEREMAQRDATLKVCDEIYVVREGETLQTISEKCGDPYILEENPHINDPDDVFPGLVIKITPFQQIFHGFLS